MWDSSGFDDPMGNGGGFLNKTNNLNSPAGKKDTAKRPHNVVPIVTRQINDSQDEEFTLFGLECQIVCLVGMLRDWQVSSTKATCTIEDHTGKINAIFWLENDSDSVSQLPDVEQDTYVQVYGSLRKQDGEKIIMILQMFPVKDYNVILHHLLKMIETRCAAEEATRKTTVMLPRPAANSTMSFSNMNVENLTNTTTNSGGDDELGLNPIQSKIFRILQPLEDAVGLGKDKLMAHFNPGQKREIEQALAFMLDEGHVYTTIDTNHYKATNYML